MNTTVFANISILQEVDEFNEYIVGSDVFLNYIETKQAVQRDEEAISLIKEFAKIKEKYQEVQRFSKHHPDFKDVSKETRIWKRKVDTHYLIADYKKAENELYSLLAEVSQIIATAVSKNIKVPTGNPFFDQSGCSSGGCGSGGPCGCK